MKSMGSGSGIRLTTGETIGAWQLSDHDGKREAEPSGGENPQTTPLPKGESSAQPEEDAEAD